MEQNLDFTMKFDGITEDKMKVSEVLDTQYSHITLLEM